MSVIRILVATQSTSLIMDRSRCSVPTADERSLRASFSLFSKISSSRGLCSGFLLPSISSAGAISSPMR